MKLNTPLPCDSIRSIALPTFRSPRDSESVCSDVTRSIHHHDRNGSGGESVLDLIRGFAVAHDCIACGPGCGGCDWFDYQLSCPVPATLTGYPLSAAVRFGGSFQPPSICIAALLRKSARHDLTIPRTLLCREPSRLPDSVPNSVFRVKSWFQPAGSLLPAQAARVLTSPGGQVGI